jgi:NADH-quinone oxidoreductase subunit L
VLTALLTAFYMSRLYLRVFEGDLVHPDGVHPHEAPPSMAAALVPLGALSIVGGAVNLPGLLTLEHFLEPVVGHSEVPSGIVPWLLAGVALLVAASGIVFAGALYRSASGDARRAAVYARGRPLIDAARNKFYVDELYARTVVFPGKALASFSAFVVDARVIDGLVMGVGRAVAWSAEGLRRVQTGYVRNYGATFLLGVVIIFSILLARVSLS